MGIKGAPGSLQLSIAESCGQCSVVGCCVCRRRLVVLRLCVFVSIPRDTAEQEASFRRAMSNMHMMYAHQSTLTFRLECLTPADTWTARKEDSTYKVPIYHLPSNSIAWVPLSELMENFAFYLDRGWCRAEIEWSAARGIPAQNIAIDGEPGKEVTVKMVPTAPEVFGKRMTTSAFTHRNDASTVVDLQRKIFHQKVTVRKHLKLEHLTQADMVELAASLPYFPQLKVLDIYIFQAGEAEAKAFFEAGQVLKERARYAKFVNSISLRIVCAFLFHLMISWGHFKGA